MWRRTFPSENASISYACASSMATVRAWAKTSSGGPLFVDGPAVLLALVGAGPLLLGALPRLDFRVRRRKRKAD